MLSKGDLHFLLSLVHADGDFHDGEEPIGWANFDVEDGILTVSFEDADNEVTEASWELTLLD